MVIALLLSLLLAQATTPKATPAPKPQPTAPPKAAPAQPRTPTARQPAGAVGGMAITVTDGKGTVFSDVTVELTVVASGATSSGKTNAAGQFNIPGLRAGTYHLRFSGEEVIAFEREVTLKPGEVAPLRITLRAAPAPPPPAAPPPAPVPPARPVVGPLGEPQLGSLTSLADKERNAKERREMLLACSGNTRNVLVVITSEQPQRVYEGAESTYYVISGQGSATVGKYNSLITSGSFIAVPRGIPFSLTRSGNRPLALLWTLSGEPCETAR